jgi:hypothetical protein
MLDFYLILQEMGVSIGLGCVPKPELCVLLKIPFIPETKGAFIETMRLSALENKGENLLPLGEYFASKKASYASPGLKR